MANISRKFNTLVENCLMSIIALSVVSCSSQPPRKTSLELLAKAKEFKLQKEFVEKRAVIGRLEAKITQRPDLSPKVSFQPAPKQVNVEIKKLHPQEDALDDDQLNSQIGEDEESVSDSSQEILHFYFQGYQQLSAGKFEEAIRSLSHFLEENPIHVYADRAQYLITEANCRAKEYHLCLLAANTLESRYPYSLKLPEAIGLKVQALRNMGQTAEASKTLVRLSRTYPDHPALNKASESNAKVKVPPPLLEGIDE